MTLQKELGRFLKELMPAKKYIDSFIVINEKGLHTRPSTELVKCASAFKSKVSLHFMDLSVNAKSLLGILMLAAARGSKIIVEAVGEDSEAAVKAIIELASNKFYVMY